MKQTFIHSVVAYALLCVQLVSSSHESQHYDSQTEQLILGTNETISDLPMSTREHWMRRAITALSDLSSPCHFAAFGTAIVNHTDTSGLSDLICIGINSAAQEGNPTLHGEIACIRNCTKVLTDPNGPHKLSPEQARLAFSQLSLYTTAEACPMCASAIRWSGFREYIYATSIPTLTAYGWSQINLRSSEVFDRSSGLPSSTVLIPDVLAEETDLLFQWQFNDSAPCPSGCSRQGGTCQKS